MEEQMQKNGGTIYHYAYCVKSNKEFKATLLGQGVQYVKDLGYQHCMANGGSNKGHRYTVLY